VRQGDRDWPGGGAGAGRGKESALGNISLDRGTVKSVVPQALSTIAGLVWFVPGTRLDIEAESYKPRHESALQ
jgi:hypothetical protein